MDDTPNRCQGSDRGRNPPDIVIEHDRRLPKSLITAGIIQEGIGQCRKIILMQSGVGVMAGNSGKADINNSFLINSGSTIDLAAQAELLDLPLTSPIHPDEKSYAGNRTFS